MDNPEVYNVVGAVLPGGGENYYVYKRQGDEEFTLNVVILGDQAYAMCSDKLKSSTTTPVMARYSISIHAAKAAKMSVASVHKVGIGLIVK